MKWQNVSFWHNENYMGPTELSIMSFVKSKKRKRLRERNIYTKRENENNSSRLDLSQEKINN